jgi:hypothetical protein
MSEEDVHFYLGFSIAGPLAYNVKPIRYAKVSIQSHAIMVDSDAVEKYIYDETVETLQQKIELIEDLKIKLKEGNILSEKHVSLCNFLLLSTVMSYLLKLFCNNHSSRKRTINILIHRTLISVLFDFVKMYNQCYYSLVTTFTISILAFRTQERPRHMALEIEVIAYDRHKM